MDLFTLTLLPTVFLLGVFSYLRLVQTSLRAWCMPWGRCGSASTSCAGPGGGAVLPTDRPQGITKLERIGVVTTGPLQLLTAASMVAGINAMVGGLAVALGLRSLLDAPVPIAAATGTVVAVALAGLCVGHQVWRFRRAAAVVPELFEAKARTCPGGRPRDKTQAALAPR